MKVGHVVAPATLLGALVLSAGSSTVSASGSLIDSSSWFAGEAASTPRAGTLAPFHDTWVAGQALPTARGFLASATVGPLTYSVGGCSDGVCKQAYTANEAFNSSTGTWTTEAAMPTARGGLAAAASNGIIYAFGGSSAPCCTPLRTNEAFDPNKNAWTEEAPVPTGRFGLVAAKGADGLVYTFGGKPAAKVVEAYDPSTHAWTCSVGDASPGCTTSTIAAIPESVYGGAAVADGTIIYVMVGHERPHMWAYDVSANTWTKMAPMPTAREYLGAALGSNGLIYAIGGMRHGVLSANEAYNPSSNSWTEASPLPAAVVGPAVATTSAGTIQVAGGGTDSKGDASALNQIYTP